MRNFGIDFPTFDLKNIHYKTYIIMRARRRPDFFLRIRESNSVILLRKSIKMNPKSSKKIGAFADPAITRGE